MPSNDPISKNLRFGFPAMGPKNRSRFSGFIQFTLKLLNGSAPSKEFSSAIYSLEIFDLSYTVLYMRGVSHFQIPMTLMKYGNTADVSNGRTELL